MPLILPDDGSGVGVGLMAVPLQAATISAKMANPAIRRNFITIVYLLHIIRFRIHSSIHLQAA
jgi:hypothetical protein